MHDDTIPPRKKKRKVPKKNKYQYTLKRVLMIIAGLLLAIGLMASFYVVGVIRDLEDFDPDELGKYQQTSFIYDRQDEFVTGIHGIENRIRIPLNNIPQHVRDAFISVEDIRFEQHHGFDVRRMFGALIENIRARALVQGAGTITQQLIRNTILTKEKKFSRKIQEIYLAYQIERRYSKDQILEMYLNVIYFARGAYGIEAASKTYFGKSTNDLSIAEGALLAGIIKNPHRYSPFINLDQSLERKDLAISLMVRYERLTQAEGETAKKETITFIEDVRPGLPHGYYIDMTLEEAAVRLDITEDLLYTAGYRIYTTLDVEMQRIAEDLYADDDLFPKSPVSSESSEGALVVLDNATGEIRALLGGRRYPAEKRKVLNRARSSERQPGSTIKPLVVYGAAIENHGYTTVSFIEDAPVTYGNYTPSNYGGTFHGIVTLRESLARSINIPAVKILQDIGIGRGIAFAQDLGITFATEDRTNLSIALGGTEKGISPLDLARAFAAFGDRGSYKDYFTIRRIEDPQGSILYEYRPVKHQVLSEATAFLLTSILESSTRQGGTASRLGTLPFPLSAKTGTVQLPNTPQFAGVQGHNDAWIVAYNPEYTFTVWMGFDRPTSNYLPTNAVGGTFPAEIVKRLAAAIYENKTPPIYRKPLEVIETKLDGKALWEDRRVLLASPLTPDSYVQVEYFTRGTLPQQTSDYWSAPQAPSQFTVQIGPEGLPSIAFTPRDTFAAYWVYRSLEGSNTSDVLERIHTGTLERVEWNDNTAAPGRRYGYYILPVHTELILAGESVQGPSSPILFITVPDLILPDIDDFFPPNENGFFPPEEETEDELNETSVDDDSIEMEVIR